MRYPSNLPYLCVGNHSKFRLDILRFLLRHGKQAILTYGLLFRVGCGHGLEPAKAFHAVSDAGFESRTLILLTWL